MRRNDAIDFTMRLYNRMPAYYRFYDAQEGYPLLALWRVIGEQAANLRQDLDALWDNYFIETCDDWAVPYIGALVGVNPSQHPIGQSDRLEVWKAISWRRGKGTLNTLSEVANAVGGWPADLAEFFRVLGWSQNLNHPRPMALLTAGLSDPHALDLLGQASDTFAHAVDIRVPHPCDQARVTPDSLGIGRAAWGTPGRYGIKHLGVFCRRLETFRLQGVTPAPVHGTTDPSGTTRCSFDPLGHDTPLFVTASCLPLSRATFEQAPWAYWGQDLAIRRFGVLLAGAISPEDAPASWPGYADDPRSCRFTDGRLERSVPASQDPFSFGGQLAGGTPYSRVNLRLLDPTSFELGGAHFIVTATWQQDGRGDPLPLAALSTLHAALHTESASYSLYDADTTYGAGHLVIRIETGRPVGAAEESSPRRRVAARVGWPQAWSSLSHAPPARFPGAVLAIHAVRHGVWHAADALYVYLPPCFITPAAPMTFEVKDDGSTARVADEGEEPLGRASGGQVYPSRVLRPGVAPVATITRLHRVRNGLRLLDHERLEADDGLAMRVEVGLCDVSADVFNTAFAALLGAVATARQEHVALQGLDVPNPWPAFAYAPVAEDAPLADAAQFVLGVHLVPLQGDFLPRAELIVTGRDGQTLLVYLPEVSGVGPDGVWLLVADDGSTYLAPAPDEKISIWRSRSYAGLALARAAAGQVLPLPGEWPLRQRVLVAIDLTGEDERSWQRVRRVLRRGDLGIDPEHGRFALHDDPILRDGSALLDGSWSVDYVEAFSGPVGARPFDGQFDPTVAPTRLVARSGDAWSALAPQAAVHGDLAAALREAQDGEVIEIADSATYAAAAPIEIPARLKTLTVRAGSGQRPCLTFYHDGVPTVASLRIRAPMDALTISGLLISGGPLLIEDSVAQLRLMGCTLDPRSGARAHCSLAAIGPGSDQSDSFLLCRCITGALRTGPGVHHLTIADSIVDRRGTLAIGGAPSAEELSAPRGAAPGDAHAPSRANAGGAGAPLTAARSLHLERVTVFGQVRCDLLQASDCLFDDTVTVGDRQSGCIRFSRFEFRRPGPEPALPQRYHCVPTTAQRSECPPGRRCIAPIFNSRRFGRPDYAQLASAAPHVLLTAAESGAEVGVFADTLGTLRLGNLQTKLNDYLPAGLAAALIAQT